MRRCMPPEKVSTRSLARSEQSNARENLVDARLQLRAAQTVKMSLMPEILASGQLGVDALRLEHDADAAAQRSGFADGVKAGDHRRARRGHHERGKNAEERRFAAAVGAEQAKEFCWTNVERNAVERGAVLVAVNQIANLNDGRARRLGESFGGREVNGG